MKKKYIIEVDESEIIEYWSEHGVKEIGYQEYALNSCPNIKVKPYEERPQGEWIENNYGKIQCSICKGFAISTMTGCLMDRHLEQYKTKFCPWCGADMQRGGAE